MHDKLVLRVNLGHDLSNILRKVMALRSVVPYIRTQFGGGGGIYLALTANCLILEKSFNLPGHIYPM